MTVLDPKRDALPSTGLLGAADPGLATHLRRHGPLPGTGPGLIGELERAGLTGRGGAAFPTWRKLAAVRDGASRRTPVVVGNGAEGEPRSAKDRTLLARGPHLVLDGLQAAAAATGAGRAYLLAHPLVVATVRAAAAERTDPVPVTVVAGDGGFLDGEETAVVARLGGRPPLPGDKLRRVVERGVGGRPTAVLNVETLAHTGLVARRGAAWFRSAGTAAEPGTMLATGPSGVVEVPVGVPLAELVGEAQAPVLVGGFHGAWLAPEEAARARLSAESLREFGAAPGAGVLHVPAAGTCGLVETAEITEYLAGVSAGQCGPCRFGLPTLAVRLRELVDGRPHSAEEIARLNGMVAGRGACHHPDGTVALVRSALRVFAPDIRAHQRGGCLARTPGGS